MIRDDVTSTAVVAHTRQLFVTFTEARDAGAVRGAGRGLTRAPLKQRRREREARLGDRGHEAAQCKKPSVGM